jgi:guanosine-3',5'-bis(diphosphate) 3'-pyrophosphohydrolase
MTRDIIHKAMEFAKERHAGLTRKNKSSEPVQIHLAEVALLALKAGVSNDGIAAAWLHDILEDTSTTHEELCNIFGNEIADLVNDLTDPKDFINLPLLERKRRQADRLSKKQGEVLLIKLCDQISNVRSVCNDPPIIDWDNQKSLDYANGAKLIALVCTGQSTSLDQSFNEIYSQTIEKYSK